MYAIRSYYEHQLALILIIHGIEPRVKQLKDMGFANHIDRWPFVDLVIKDDATQEDLQCLLEASASYIFV